MYIAYYIYVFFSIVEVYLISGRLSNILSDNNRSDFDAKTYYAHYWTVKLGVKQPYIKISILL